MDYDARDIIIHLNSLIYNIIWDIMQRIYNANNLIHIFAYLMHALYI